MQHYLSLHKDKDTCVVAVFWESTKPKTTPNHGGRRMSKKRFHVIFWKKERISLLNSWAERERERDTWGALWFAHDPNEIRETGSSIFWAASAPTIAGCGCCNSNTYVIIIIKSSDPTWWFRLNFINLCGASSAAAAAPISSSMSVCTSFRFLLSFFPSPQKP